MLRLFTISICFFISACTVIGPHKEAFSQGKIITQEMMSDIYVGMTEFTAKEYLGDPVYKLEKDDVVRWYYPFYEINKVESRQQEIILVFKDGSLDEILGDVVLTEANL